MRILPISALICLSTKLVAQVDLPLVQVPEEPVAQNVNTGFNFQLAPQVPPNITVQNDGGITFLNSLGLIRYDGNVSVTAKDGLELYSDTAEINTKLKIITLRGNVSIFQNGSLFRGSMATYNYETEHLDTSLLRTGFHPLLLQADAFTSKTDKKGRVYYSGENAGITTHDAESPNYWFKAKRVNVYPEKRVTFKNLKVYAGDTPIFWLPYLSQPLDSDLGYHFSPGAKSDWGAFLLNTYGILLDTPDSEEPWLLSKWRFDLRSLRGAAIGLDLQDTRSSDNFNFPGFKSYFAYDDDPLRSRNGILREDVDPNRFKLELKHRHWLKKDANSSQRLELNLSFLSDENFLEDFEQSVFQFDPEPDNTIALLHQTDQYLAGLQVRLPINQFYQSDSRLPELFFEVPRQTLGESSILYESFSSVGLYEERLTDDNRDSLFEEASTLSSFDPRFDEIQNLLNETQYGRFHTYHEISRPIKTSNGLSITPRAGVGFTQYSLTESDSSQFDNFNRTHLFAGVDASLKFSKHYDHLKSKRWGLNEALHVVRPFINFSNLASNNFDFDFEAVDTLTPTTRPRAINVGRFSAIDDLKDWSVIRLGVQNTILTKRNGTSHPWLTLDTHIDAFIEDPEFDRDASNLYNTLAWTPLPWFRLNIETQFPIVSDSSNFTELSSSLNFMPHENWEFTVGYRYLESHPTFVDSSLVQLRTFGRLSETWGLGMYQQWQLDDNTLELQEYTVHRDLGSWNLSLGAFIRDNRIENEFGLLISFQLSDLLQ